MQYTITLPDSLAVEVHGHSIVTDLGKVNAQMITMAALLGLGQKLRNGAASALVDAVAAFADELADSGKADESKAVLATLDKDRKADRVAWGNLNPKAVVKHAIAGVEKVRDAALYAGTWEIRGAAGLPLQMRNEIADVVAAMAGLKQTKLVDRRAAAMEVFAKQDDATQEAIRAKAGENIAERARLAEIEKARLVETAKDLSAGFTLKL